jgi:hypothetical protein
MSATDHKSLMNAIVDTSKQYPASTLAASQTILSQLQHKPGQCIALFTGADTPTKPAPLSQLSSKHPNTLYSFPDVISLTNHTCFVTHQHQLHLLSTPNLITLTSAMNAALHSFLKQTINASSVTHDARPSTIMASPDNHLTSIPSFYSQTILVSNLFIGEANRPSN